MAWHGMTCSDMQRHAVACMVCNSVQSRAMPPIDTITCGSNMTGGGVAGNGPTVLCCAVGPWDLRHATCLTSLTTCGRRLELLPRAHAWHTIYSAPTIDCHTHGTRYMARARVLTIYILAILTHLSPARPCRSLPPFGASTLWQVPVIVKPWCQYKSLTQCHAYMPCCVTRRCTVTP